MSQHLVHRFLAEFSHANLSAWDILRILLSECAFSECEAKGFEVHFSANSPAHYWIKCGDVWLDCGRINDYSAKIQLLTQIEVSQSINMEPLECALLSPEQINLICMQNSHFDHC